MKLYYINSLYNIRSTVLRKEASERMDALQTGEPRVRSGGTDDNHRNLVVVSDSGEYIAPGWRISGIQICVQDEKRKVRGQPASFCCE
jgi:hypothetical protein